MTAFPAAGDYYKAVQAPARSFTVPKLQAAEFVWDSLGPTLARGSSAVVFQASVEGKPQALRCYIRNDASSRDRYGALDAYLAGHDLGASVSGATWIDSAIMVNRATWPVLTMDWIDGRTLNEYVDFLVAGTNAVALTTLAVRWRELIALLQRSEFTHGDLQHGNVMVDQEGRLRLVDFDGVWIPYLAGQSPPTEYGHPNYQHPGVRVWGRWFDTFSALVIYLSLVALGKEPGLWLALYNSKNLLFAKNDFFPPFKTEAWKQLAAMGDPQVDELVRRLQECCHPDWVPDKSLEMVLDQRVVTPARAPIPVDQRWWEKKPLAAGGSAAEAGSAAAGSPSRPRPQGAPSAGQQPSPAAASSSASPPAAASPSGAAASAASPSGAMPSGSASPAPASPAPAPSGAALPAPPPLSAPLGMAGTGPMPQLSQVMALPGATIWWSGPGSASGQAPPRQAPPGPTAPGAVWPGPVPPMPGPPTPGPPTPGRPTSAPPASAAKRQPGPLAGGIALGLGIVLLIIGAAGHLFIVVIGGLVAGAWGMWRLVTVTGNNPKPPGQT